ncbi:uncharacterized protein LOC117331074 [Pecten maximus]|uniref:uncharacterized protein LOC117331074 n=1 Tax=Pecten maximus TaxID=6579 RepID=UPI0014591484|nr:uncharacterized protein LOC117331074 [Pecten maximus]
MTSTSPATSTKTSKGQTLRTTATMSPVFITTSTTRRATTSYLMIMDTANTQVATSTYTPAAPQDKPSVTGQRNSDRIPIIAALSSVLVVTVAAISVIVLISIRRRKSDRKPSDGLEYITNNTAYGTTTTSPEVPDPTPGPDGVEYDEISCETAAKPEIKADEAHSYCYAAYDNVKHPYAPDRRSALISSDDNSYFVLGKETQQGDRHEQAQPALTQQQAEQEQL